MNATRRIDPLAAAGIAGAVAVGAASAFVGPLVIAGLVAAALMSVAAKYVARVAVAPSKVVEVVAAGSLVLVAAPAVVPHPAAKLASVAVLAVAIGLVRPAGRLPRSTWALYALLGLTVVAMIRSAAAGVWAGWSQAGYLAALTATLAVFAARYARSAAGPQEQQRRLAALASAPGILAAANVVLWAVGDRLPLLVIPEPTGIATELPASILGSVGIGMLRQQLPLSSGVNSIGLVAAAGIVASSVLAARSRGTVRLWHGAMVVSCVAASVLSDTRAALAIAAVIATVAVMAPRVRVARGAAILLPLSPVVLVLGLGWLANSTISRSLSRNAGDFATGTGRTDIWRAVWEHSLSSPTPMHLFGYGANGQIPSGVYPWYAGMFGDREGTFTVHNVYLQAIMDTGYIGALLLVAVVVIAVGRLARAGLAGAALGWALVGLMLCGVTEALPSIYSVEVWALFVVLTATAAGIRFRPRARSR